MFASHLGDFQGGRDDRVAGNDLSAVLPGHRFAQAERLEAGILDSLVEAGLEHGPLQQLDHGFDAEGTWLHRILEEVGLEEPFLGIDIFLGAVATQAGYASCENVQCSAFYIKTNETNTNE